MRSMESVQPFAAAFILAVLLALGPLLFLHSKLVFPAIAISRLLKS